MYVVMNKLKNIISIENKHMIKYIMRMYYHYLHYAVFLQ